MTPCQHDRYSTEYCDDCHRQYMDLMDSLAHRTSHDSTPFLPAKGRTS